MPPFAPFGKRKNGIFHGKMFCDFSTKAGPRRTATKRTFLPASAPRTRKAEKGRRPAPSRTFSCVCGIPEPCGKARKKPPASEEAGGWSPAGLTERHSASVQKADEETAEETRTEERAASTVRTTRKRGSWMGGHPKGGEETCSFPDARHAPRVRSRYRAWKYSRGCAQAGQDSGASRPSCT